MSASISRVDGNEELAMDADDYINAKICSMLGNCTEDSPLRHGLEMAQKYVLSLQQEVRELQCKLQAETVRSKKAREEASLNAHALKNSISDCEVLRQELRRLMEEEIPSSSWPEHREELACNVRQGESLENVGLQLGGSSSSGQTKNVYGHNKARAEKLAELDINEGFEVGLSADPLNYWSPLTPKLNLKEGQAKLLEFANKYLSARRGEQNSK